LLGGSRGERKYHVFRCRVSGVGYFFNRMILPCKLART
jgi:hypothetical protein